TLSSTRCPTNSGIRLSSSTRSRIRRLTLFPTTLLCSAQHLQKSRRAMLDLRSASRVLGKFHDRFHDDALPSDLSLEAFAAFDRGAYDAASLEWGLGAWQARLLDEYRSQVAFTDLLLQLTELGFSFDVLGTAVRVVRDEARHVELCRRMVHALGGDDIIPGEPGYVNPDKS